MIRAQRPEGFVNSCPGWTAIVVVLLICCNTSNALSAPATLPAFQRFEYVRPKMGTVFRIVLYAERAKEADEAAEAAFARIDQLNSELSDYDTKSELSLLSQRTLAGPMIEPVKVSDDLWRILVASQEAAERSEGAFDITLGPFVKLWRRSRDMIQLPTPQRLEEARKSVGYRFMKLDKEKQTVQLLAARMRLDVGGIGKGFTSGEAMAVLKQHGITRAAVGAAGDLTVSDPPPGQTGWRVAIQSLPMNAAPSSRPTSHPTDLHVTGQAQLADDATPDFGGSYVRLSNYGASTSSDTERYTIIGGQRYSHIIDPATGLGMTQRVGATVIAADDTTADWMALAVCLMGPVRGMKLVDDTPGAAARLVVLEGDHVAVYESRRFKDFQPK